MDAATAIYRMARRRGLSLNEVSRRCGKNASYAAGVVSRGYSPSVRTFARICGACGYGIAVVDPRTGDGMRLYDEFARWSD